MADEVDLDEAMDALYATPPEDFVAARNGLVKALKAGGQTKTAAEVGALRKPNRLVWALNQLALDGDSSLAPLLDAADVVRYDTADDMRAAMAGLRDAVNAAAGAALSRLDAHPSDRADLAAALLAVVADDRARDQLSGGRLQEIPAPDAFGLGPGPAASSKATVPRPAKPKPKPKAGEPSDRPPDQLAIRRATKRRKEAAKEADAAERARARAEKAVAAGAERRAQADQARERAAEAVADAEKALEQAQRDLARAEQAAADAVDAHEQVAGALAEAEDRADAAAAELSEATTELDALAP